MTNLGNVAYRLLISWTVRLLLGAALSAVCLVLIARTASVAEVGTTLGHGHPAVLVPAMALYFGGLMVRSVRWGLLLPGRRLPPGLLFRTLVIGLMVNDVLPARLGEVARIVLLAKNASTPIGVSFASIVVERVLDGVALMVLLALGMALAGTGAWIVHMLFFSGLFVTAISITLWAALAPDLARALAGVLIARFPERFRAPLRRTLDGTLEGLRPITSPVIGISVLALSLLAWAIEAAVYVVIMLGFNVPDALAAGPFGASVANLATLIPSSPASIGTFDLALQRVLIDVFNVATEVATAATLIVHLAVLLPIVALGLVFLWKEDLSLAQLVRRPRSLQRAAATASDG